MNRLERLKEIAKASPDFGKGVGYKMCVVDELYDMKELKRENAELKRDLEELTITDNYQKVISDKNERISFLEAQLFKAIKLLAFWVNDFYNNSSNPKKYKERHKALVETEQILKEK